MQIYRKLHKLSSRKERIAVELEENNIHKSLRFIFVIAQFLGFFPIQGVLSPKPDSISFSWFSLKILSAAFTSIGGLLVAVGHICHIILTGYNQFDMNGFVFYTCGSFSCIFFLKIAQEWKSIVLKWKEVDVAMASYGWPKNFDKRLRIISAIFLTLETFEHFSIQANKMIVSIQCKGSLSEGFEHFTKNMSFPVIFDVIKPFYASWLGLLFQLINTRLALSWAFLDLFIMLLSCGLAMRFKQINSRVQSLINMKAQSERGWSCVNDEYNRLCRLVLLLDEKLSFLILISFFNNFYFIIFQLFDSLSFHRFTTLEAIYYFISLTLLLSRTIAICLYASWINEESKKPLDLIAIVSHETCNKEVMRFLESVKYQDVGLTGKKFFKISRQLILKIASATVTYELVVIQFNNNMIKSDQPTTNSLC